MGTLSTAPAAALENTQGGFLAGTVVHAVTDGSALGVHQDTGTAQTV